MRSVLPHPPAVLVGGAALGMLLYDQLKELPGIRLIGPRTGRGGTRGIIGELWMPPALQMFGCWRLNEVIEIIGCICRCCRLDGRRGSQCERGGAALAT